MTTALIDREQKDALKREQYLKDLLITATEGGTNYWAQVSGYNADEGWATYWEYAEEGDDEGTIRHDLTLGVIERGIRRIIAGEINVARSIREDVIVNSVDNDFVRGDAETADCIVQAGLFGEVRYG